MAVPSQEKGYQKYAWVLPFVFGLLLVVIGIVGLSKGYTAENPPVPPSTPAAAIDTINSIYQGFELTLIFVGLSFALVSATGFKGGHKWGWYFILLWFVFILLEEGLYLGTDLIGYIGLVLLGLGLLLPYRKFFPKKQITS